MKIVEKIEKFLNVKVNEKKISKEEALEKLKKTNVLTTDLLEPLGIGFESFLKLAQQHSSKQIKDITAKLIIYIEKDLK